VGTCTPRVQAKTTTVGFHGLTLISIAEWVEGEKKSNVITTIGADKSVYILPWCPSGPNAKMIKTKKTRVLVEWCGKKSRIQNLCLFLRG